VVEDVVDVGVGEGECPAISAGSAPEGTLRNDRTGGLLVIDDGAGRGGRRDAERADHQDGAEDGAESRAMAMRRGCRVERHGESPLRRSPDELTPKLAFTLPIVKLRVVSCSGASAEHDES